MQSQLAQLVATATQEAAAVATRAVAAHAGEHGMRLKGPAASLGAAAGKRDAEGGQRILLRGRGERRLALGE